MEEAYDMDDPNIQFFEIDDADRVNDVDENCTVFTLDDSYFIESENSTNNSVTILNLDAADYSKVPEPVIFPKLEKNPQTVSVYRVVPIRNNALDPAKPKKLSFTKEDLEASQLIQISEDGLITTSGDPLFIPQTVLEKLSRKHMKKRNKRKITHVIPKEEESSKELTCHQCQKVFKQATHLKRHQNIHAGIKPFACEICLKQFYDHTTMTRHRKTHSGEKPWNCKICNKFFSTLGSLRRHITVHYQEGRPYECSTCHKRFPDRSSCKKHELIHTGVKPHGCDVCGKRFVHIGDLNGHKKIHTNVKEFECSDCGKQFVKRSNYMRHITIHQGVQKYMCKFCRVSYNHQSSLTRHLLLHKKGARKEKTVTCDICSQVCKSSSELKTHLIEHLNKVKEEEARCAAHLKEIEESVDDVQDSAAIEENASENDDQKGNMHYIVVGNMDQNVDEGRNEETTNSANTSETSEQQEESVARVSEPEVKPRSLKTESVSRQQNKPGSQQLLTLEEIRFLRRKLNKCKKISETERVQNKFDIPKPKVIRLKDGPRVIKMKSYRVSNVTVNTPGTQTGNELIIGDVFSV